MSAGVATVSTDASCRPVPGYTNRWSLRAMRRWRDDPLAFFSALCEEYGDIAQWRVGPYTTVVLRDPEHAKRVLVDHHRSYTKGARGWTVMRSVFGNGLLTSEGDFWLRQRRIAQPAFHKTQIAGFASTMATEAQSVVDRWLQRRDRDEPLDVHHEMMRLTLRVVVSTLFGRDLGGDIDALSDAIGTMLTSLRWRVTHIWPAWTPHPVNVRCRRAVRAIDEVVFSLIRNRRELGEQQPDLLGMLMTATDPDTGETMTDAQLRDEVLTVFLAGHETTANALSWTFHLLSKHPDVARRLTDEVDRLDAGPIGLADLKALPYTQMVLQESLRLYPPAWAIPRAADRDDVIDGFAIPKGAGIVLSPYLTQRHPRYWPNPEGFDPERFAGDALKRLPKFAYFPFGGGPRLCIGKAFAMMEATISLAMIARRFDLELLPGRPVRPQPAITLRPRDGLLMRVRPRD